MLDRDPELMTLVAARALPLLDLTSLGDDDTTAEIDALCTSATTPAGPVAAVCVRPRFVDRAHEFVSDHGIAVASVANFPVGDPDPDRAVADALAILESGGDEVDVVFPWRRLAAGDEVAGRRLVAATRTATAGHTLKVILETGELSDADCIVRAAEIALDEGADFLSTSTGTTATSATPDAVRLLLGLIEWSGVSAGVQVSGGVQTTEQAADYLAIADEVMGPDWVSPNTFRFGAGSLFDDVLAALDGSADAR